MSEDTHFKYAEEMEAVIVPDDGDTHVKILHVANVIPIRVKYEIDGVVNHVAGYVDYETQQIDIQDSLPYIDELKCKILTFLQWRSDNDVTIPEVPPEVIEQFEEERAKCRKN